ncbi:MAG: alpha/beta hydrolase [Chitinophagaceae bacterium]|nr:alpha/beta hydrolase [Chitinophagaceae bacterium]
MRKKRYWILVPLILLIVYLIGPRPSTPLYSKDLPMVPVSSNSLEKYVSISESRHKLRPDNYARIIWANDSLKQKTEYAIVYLHGFSASQGEGDPVHRTIAKKFGCNLYLSRLAEHGIDTTEQLMTLTADELWESAKQALAIGSKIGKKVILMGTSTGGTLALMLAANYSDIHSIILLSPNISIFDNNAWLLNNPWGLQVARMVVGSDYVYSADTRPIYKQYWNYGYRLEAATQLEEMLESGMRPDLFKKVTQPTLLLYYYKDPVHQDSVVKVSDMLKMFTELGTPASKKRSVAMPKAGNHVLGSYIKSKDVEGVTAEIEKFMTEILKMSTPK